MGGVPNYRFPSPLRYPGGKGKISNYIKLIFLENDLVGTTYAEPYAGGASVALTLLFEEYAEHILINDVDRSIAAFWRTVLKDAHALCDLIMSTDVTMSEWENQREVQAGLNSNDLELAFSTFFLNRTNRSGILKGGVIGGRGQSGDLKLDARYNKTDLCRRILKIRRFRNRITFTQLDAELFLADLPDEDRFVYLDPPYYLKGSDLYTSWYTAEDHGRLARQVERLAEPWIVLYDACPEIERLYGQVNRIEYDLSYSASAPRKGSEWIYRSPGLRLPGVLPTHISLDDVEAERERLSS